MSGMKVYNKIQIEGQLREDADYAVTMVMNTFYSYPFDYVQGCGDNCIELVNEFQTNIKEYDGFYDFYSGDEDDPSTIKISFSDIGTSDNPKKSISIHGDTLNTFSDFKDSEITITCNQYKDTEMKECQKGIITLNFLLDHNRLTEPLNLESQFGF
jgi:hypothetical protein